MSRTAIPESIKREVLTEAGFRCAVPTCRTILAIDLHHIIEVSDNGPNEAYNLLAPTSAEMRHGLCASAFCAASILNLEKIKYS